MLENLKTNDASCEVQTLDYRKKTKYIFKFSTIPIKSQNTDQNRLVKFWQKWKQLKVAIEEKKIDRYRTKCTASSHSTNYVELRKTFIKAANN